MAAHDPLLVTFELVAEAAGVSRTLVHAYLGDRRGLIDAVQVRIIDRLDTWVGHGLRRATSGRGRLTALVHGLFAYVDSERDAWGVLAASGGFDHPAFHGVRHRWAAGLDGTEELAAQVVVAALVGGVGTWVNRGTSPEEVLAALTPMVAP